jgi:hypothetical protein
MLLCTVPSSCSASCVACASAPTMPRKAPLPPSDSEPTCGIRIPCIPNKVRFRCIPASTAHGELWNTHGIHTLAIASRSTHSYSQLTHSFAHTRVPHTLCEVCLQCVEGWQCLAAVRCSMQVQSVQSPHPFHTSHRHCVYASGTPISHFPSPLCLCQRHTSHPHPST